jgi:hypothetical protein
MISPDQLERKGEAGFQRIDEVCIEYQAMYVLVTSWARCTPGNKFTLSQRPLELNSTRQQLATLRESVHPWKSSTGQSTLSANR